MIIGLCCFLLVERRVLFFGVQYHVECSILADDPKEDRLSRGHLSNGVIEILNRCDLLLVNVLNEITFAKTCTLTDAVRFNLRNDDSGVVFKFKFLSEVTRKSLKVQTEVDIDIVV